MGKIKRSFALESKLQTRWGGNDLVQVNQTFFASINDTIVYIIDSQNGKTVAKLQDPEDNENKIRDVAVDPLLRFAITSHEVQSTASALLKFWIPAEETWNVTNAWKFASSTTPALLINPEGTAFAAAATNGGCFFYSVATQKLLGKGKIEKGQITSMKYDRKGQLWIGTNMGKLSIVNPENFKSQIIQGRDKQHANRVTGISDTGEFIYTASLDQVIHVFDHDYNHVKLIPVQFSINSMIDDPLNPNSCYCATTDGVKRVWIDENGGTHIKRINSIEYKQIIQLESLYGMDENGILLTIDAEEQHAIVLSLHSVIDSAIDEETDSIAIATSSTIISVLQGDNAFTLEGHTATPISLATYNGLLLSGARDNTARIWSLTERRLLCTLEGHSEAVSGVAFVPGTSNVITAANDNTIKMWQPGEDTDVLRSALCSAVAGNTDINGIAVSADGSLLAAAMKDKKCRLFRIGSDSITPLRDLVGHTKALWSVAFSPVDRVVATASRDQSVRVFSIDDGACLSTFNAFENGVLRVAFINHGLQIVATEAGGDFKVLRTKTGAVDFQAPAQHADRVWALSIGEDGGRVITGAEDGTLCVWRDNTEDLEREEAETKAANAEAETELANALRNGEYVRALHLALKLGMPNKARLIVREISEKGAGDALIQYFREVESAEDFEKWLGFAAKWATNSRWADDATAVLTAMLRVKKMSYFVENRRTLQEKIDGIIPYLERHMARLERLHVDSYKIDYIVQSGAVE